MVDEGGNPLALDVVVRRFAESSEALANVRVQLQALTELRESEEQANASLQEAGGQVSRLAAGAASILKELEEAQARVAEVLQSGADLLDGSELRGIAETSEANSQAISGVDRRVDALEAKVAELLSMVGGLQTTLKGEMDTLNGKIECVHADVKTPIIVKRLW